MNVYFLSYLLLSCIVLFTITLSQKKNHTFLFTYLMENKAKGTNEMSEEILRLVGIIVSLISTTVRVIDMIIEHKNKNEHQKSNRSDQS